MRSIAAGPPDGSESSGAGRWGRKELCSLNELLFDIDLSLSANCRQLIGIGGGGGGGGGGDKVPGRGGEGVPCG
jgi:hypothetical protein